MPGITGNASRINQFEHGQEQDKPKFLPYVFDQRTWLILTKEPKYSTPALVAQDNRQQQI
jgi:hypothetical protein